MLLLFCLLSSLASAPATGTPGPSVAEVQRLFDHPPDDSRVLMRWWWFGPSVTTAEVEAEMRRMREGGIGGFELAVVYPMAVDDPARGIRNERYLSPEFLDKIAFASRKARELGLRMDVTIGSGWSFGGPYVTPDLAATRLRSDRREITPDRTSVARPAPYEGDHLIAAFVGRGSLAEVDPTSFRPLDISGTGPIPLPAGDGPRLLLLYFSSQTGQVVKRAAVGAEGYVLDHYQRAAIEKHLQEAGDKLLAAAGPGGIHAAFCDSLEVYGADWTADMLGEFQKRRGYDLRAVLPLLEYDAGERSETLRRDFGRTLTELYEERFLVPMREWAMRHGVLFRIQNYGEPPAALASSRYADQIDGEGWNFRTLTSARWASSASHLFGKPVTTSETWTWLHSPAFRATPLPLGDQPAHRPWLAVFASRGGNARVALLRGGGPQRQEPVVAGDAGPGRVSAASELPAAARRAGDGRGALRPDGRRLVHVQARNAAAREPLREDRRLDRPEGGPGHPRRRPRLRPRGRRHAGRGAGPGLQGGRAAGCAVDAGGHEALARRLRARWGSGAGGAAQARGRVAVTGAGERGRAFAEARSRGSCRPDADAFHSGRRIRPSPAARRRRVPPGQQRQPASHRQRPVPRGHALRRAVGRDDRPHRNAADPEWRARHAVRALRFAHRRVPERRRLRAARRHPHGERVRGAALGVDRELWWHGEPGGSPALVVGGHRAALLLWHGKLPPDPQGGSSCAAGTRIPGFRGREADRA